MPLLHKNSDESNKHTPKGFTNATNMSRLLRDEAGVSRYSRENLLPNAINFVNGAVAPPTTNSGDIYVLTGSGTVDAGWGITANFLDWIRYDGNVWTPVTPTAGDLCYDATAAEYKIFNGTAWVAFSSGGGGGNTIYSADDTVGSNRIATLTDQLTFRGADTSDGTGNLVIQDSTTAVLWEGRNNGDLLHSVGGLKFTSDRIKQTANASAVIELESTTKGFLIPRMTTAQKNGIVSPSTGLQVFDTDLGEIQIYNGSAWISTDTNVGNTDLTLTSDRIISLNSNDFEIERLSGQSFKIFGATGGVEILSIDTTAAFRVANGFGDTRFRVPQGGGGEWKNGDIELNHGAVNPLNGITITNGNGVEFYRQANVQHRFRTGGGGEKVTFFESTFNGGFIVGAANIIGSEDISLQGDVLMNANVNLANLPTSSTGLSAGDLWNNLGVINIV
jgi:hypothetical protein